MLSLRLTERVAALSISSNEVTLDLSQKHSRLLSLQTDDVNAFVLTNPPSGSTSFTVKILQDSTGNCSVGIDTFKDTSGNSIPVYWAWRSCSYCYHNGRQDGHLLIQDI